MGANNIKAVTLLTDQETASSSALFVGTQPDESHSPLPGLSLSPQIGLIIRHPSGGCAGCRATAHCA